MVSFHNIYFNVSKNYKDNLLIKIEFSFPGNITQLKTVSGQMCIFPFTYNGEQYQTCTTVDSILPWCPTRLDSHGMPVDWEYCQQDWSEYFLCLFSTLGSKITKELYIAIYIQDMFFLK